MRRTILLFAIVALSTAATWPRGDAFVLHRGDNQVTMTSTSLDELSALMRRLGDKEPYLWARVDGREWLIRDGALLREATALWQPARALKPTWKALAAEERRLDKRIDAIEDGKATARPGELAELRERQRETARRQRELDQRSEALEKVAQGQLHELVERAIRGGQAKPLR